MQRRTCAVGRGLVKEDLLRQISEELKGQPSSEVEKVKGILDSIGIEEGMRITGSSRVRAFHANDEINSDTGEDSIPEEVKEKISTLKDNKLKSLLLKLALVGMMAFSGMDSEAAEARAYPDNSSKAVEYKIRKGDNLYNLEKTFGIEHGVLRQMNPGLNPSRLVPGKTVIKVPKKGEKLKKTPLPDNSKNSVEYTIQNGDTFEKLEKKMSLEPNSLARENPEVDPSRLVPGKTKIKIPKASDAVLHRSGQAGVLLSREGDTLRKISERLDWSLDVLLELNPGLGADEPLKDKQKVKTFDESRLIRAFIAVETGAGPANEKIRDGKTGDNGLALGSCQWHRKEFEWAGGKDFWTTDKQGKKVLVDGRRSRAMSVQAFRTLLSKYAQATDILTVEDVLVKARWNKRHGKREYEEAYLSDLGNGISLR